MDTNIKAYDLFWKFYNGDEHFQSVVKENMEKGKLRFFDENEWNKICSQNFVSLVPDMKEFIDMFTLGYNIGNCVGASRQLSFSYDDVDIVSGILPILKGTLNAEKEGGHCWLETPTKVIDTTLMLVFDKDLKKDFGYVEEQRVTSFQLGQSPSYQARKEFVNDASLKKKDTQK